MIRLYDTSHIEATTVIPVDFRSHSYASPTWEYPLPFIDIGCKAISQLYHCSNTNELRFVLCDGDALCGITIPGDSSIGSQPQVVKLMTLKGGGWPNLPSNRRLRFGYNSVLTTNCSITHPEVLYFSWPDNPSGSLPEHSNTLIPKFNEKSWEYFAFDESSGRVVGVVGGRHIQVNVAVYDFSKFQK